MTRPQVSVLMSVRDGERYLPSALESLRAQTLAREAERVEFVLVDDGSRDGTRGLLQEFARTVEDRCRVECLHHPEPLGLTASLNRAMPRCRATYVARQDADDLSHPLRLERQVSRLEMDAGLALVGCYFEAVGPEGEHQFWSSVPTRPTDVRARLVFENAFPHSTWMARRDVLQTYRYDAQCPVAQDYELLARLSAAARVSAVSQRLVSVRRGHAERVGARRGEEQARVAARVARRALEQTLARDLTDAEAEAFGRFRSWVLGGEPAPACDAEVIEDVLGTWSREPAARRVWTTRFEAALRRARRAGFTETVAAFSPTVAAMRTGRPLPGWAGALSARFGSAPKSSPEPDPLPPCPRRVVHLVTSLNPGGATTFLRGLLDETTGRGIESVVVVIGRRGEAAKILEADGVEVRSCFVGGGLDVPFSYRLGKVLRRLGSLTFLPRLVRTLREADADVLHSHVHGGRWLTQLLAARMAGMGFVLQIHSPSSSYPQSRWFPQFQRVLRRTAGGGRLAAVSEDVRAAYPELEPVGDLVGTIPNGLPLGPAEVELDREARGALRDDLGLLRDATLVGCVGRLISMKRLDVLLEAVVRVRRIRPDRAVVAVLVGDGSARGDLEDLARRLDLGDAVHFAGFRHDPERWMEALDVFVLPSEFEGLPIAVLEAMAAGRPIVATDVAGTREVVEAGRTGLLVPVGDVEALAGALARLLDEPDLAARLGAAARQRFREAYRIDTCARRYLATYREVMPRGAMPSSVADSQGDGP